MVLFDIAVILGNCFVIHARVTIRNLADCLKKTHCDCEVSKLKLPHIRCLTRKDQSKTQLSYHIVVIPLLEADT